MRPAGFTLAAFLIGVTVVSGQQPVPPAAPGGQVPPLPPAAPPADPKLDAHLAGWEKTMGKLINFRFVLDLKRTEATFKTERGYSGVVLFMKPNFTVLRLNNDSDKTGADYEAVICDGKSFYEYNGLAKTITEHKIPNSATKPGAPTDNFMLDMLSGMKAKDAKERFDLTLFKEDAYYVYLDVKALNPNDKKDFTQLRMALYGPNTKTPYLPAQVYMSKPNGDTEVWKFKDPQTDIPNLTPKHFEAQKIPGWKEQEGGKPPAPSGVGPGQPKLPPGMVRPDLPKK
ncbi:MAG: TIGR03009 domain-containing protein [Planctomycetes bacterium]|nr:TIGR03009 domain-containing protein [Planctomycetota bacterium]